LQENGKSYRHGNFYSRSAMAQRQCPMPFYRFPAIMLTNKQTNATEHNTSSDCRRGEVIRRRQICMHVWPQTTTARRLSVYNLIDSLAMTTTLVFFFFCLLWNLLCEIKYWIGISLYACIHNTSYRPCHLKNRWSTGGVRIQNKQAISMQYFIRHGARCSAVNAFSLVCCSQAIIFTGYARNKHVDTFWI